MVMNRLFRATDQDILRSIVDGATTFSQHDRYAYLREVVVWLQKNHPEEIEVSCYRCRGNAWVDCECLDGGDKPGCYLCHGDGEFECYLCEGRGVRINIDLYEDNRRDEMQKLQKWSEVK